MAPDASNVRAMYLFTLDTILSGYPVRLLPSHLNSRRNVRVAVQLAQEDFLDRLGLGFHAVEPFDRSPQQRRHPGQILGGDPAPGFVAAVRLLGYVQALRHLGLGQPCGLARETEAPANRMVELF